MFRHSTSTIRASRRHAVLGLALSAAVAMTSLSGCSALGGSDNTAAPSTNGTLEKPKIKVSVMSTIDTTPFQLAIKNGYFKQEGLDVEAVNAASGQVSLQKLIGGEVDIAFSSYPPFFIAQSKGAADIKFVADASSAAPNSMVVVAMPNSSVKSVQDLAGKKIAITGVNTLGDTLIKSVMKDNHVDYTGVNWVTLAFPDIPAAVKSGAVDAGFLTEPFITQGAKTAGVVPILDIATGSTQGFPSAGYGSLSKFTDGNPKTVAAFQRAMQKAIKEAADRSKIEPLMVEFAKVDPDTASLTTLSTFESTLDPRRLQRVPDLLQQFGTISQHIDVTPMIAQQAGTS